MIRNISIGLVASYFFLYLIGNLSLTYDRYTVQFLVLSIINLAAFLIILKSKNFIIGLDLIKSNKQLIFYLGFIVFSLLSIIVANNKAESIIIFSQYLSFFFALILIFTLSRQMKFNIINLTLLFCIISLILESSYILYIFFDNIILNDQEFIRSNIYKGFTANINIAAFSLAAKSPVIFYYLFITSNKKYKLLLGLLLFMILSCLFILLSRGAFIAFGIVLVFMSIYSLIKLGKNYLNFSVITFSILTSYLLFSNLIVNQEQNLINQRISSIQLNQDDDSINERIRFYFAAFESVKENPFLGIGVGNWKIESMKYDAKYAIGYRVPFHAHNDFFQVAAESGIFALIFFILFLFYPFSLFFRNKLYITSDIKHFTFLVMLSIYLLDSMLNFPIARPISHIFLLFVLAALINLNEMNEKQYN